MPENLENSAAATGLEKVSFHSNHKKGNAKQCSNYRTIALISHTSKVKCDLFESAYCLIGKTISIQYILAELLQNLNYKEQTANNKKKKKSWRRWAIEDKE